MPGWHTRTLELQRSGKLQLLGIIQEQHPDRARLFMQWKQMQWPILVDSLNLLGVSAVPLTYLIDEHGIIRFVNPTLADLDRFLQQSWEPPAAETVDVADAGEPANDFDRRLAEADSLFLWGGEAALNQAIELYQALVEAAPDHGPAAFRLGVALRRRYDSPLRLGNDFQQAVHYWNQALQIDPNQYIWRRRIQQYGPRLDKPYPFYDWVRRAREEILGRGEEPAALMVEPSGAEFANPADRFAETSAPLAEPDPQDRIRDDREGFIQLEATVVPDQVPPGGAARVHLAFRPNAGIKAHWNNEVDPLVVWLRPAPGWSVDRQRLVAPMPREAVSHEVRRIEFEVQAPSSFRTSTELAGYALYYVCEDVNGTCLYRRQDFRVGLKPVEHQ